MSFLKRALPLALSLCVFAGCSRVRYDEDFTPQESGETTTETEQPQETTTVSAIAENPVVETPLVATEYSEIYQTEGNCEGYTTRTALNGYDGDGYIQLVDNNYATLTVDVPSAQHYKITAYICSASSKISLITGGENVIRSLDADFETLDGTVQGAFYAEEAVYFKEFTINGVFLKGGENKITLQNLSGIAYIDKILIETGKTVSDNFYLTSGSNADKNASTKAVKLLTYLRELYGEKTLTGQYVTPNTNTELNAVYNVTGRFPAIRAADVYVYTSGYNDGTNPKNTDTQLAVEWAQRGGIVSYSWTWYPPSEESDYIAAFTDFDFAAAYSTTDVSLLDIETIKTLYGDGEISEEAYLLIKDMDEVAEALKTLKQADVPVLWRPLMEAGNGWYWWGSDEQAYKWLWKTMFTRFTEYHELHNLIWVWNGEKDTFYPGDEYVDIVSEDVYNSYMSSANSRLMDTSYYLANGKSVALTETAVVPNPDVLARDNAMWLWFCVWRGDYAINPDGSYCPTYTSENALEYAYNHELFITRDELDIYGS